MTGNGYVEMTGYAGKLNDLAMAIGRDLKALAIRHQLAVTAATAFSWPSPAEPDSVALLHLLVRAAGRICSFILEVAHLQHGIRGEEAKEDA